MAGGWAEAGGELLAGELAEIAQGVDAQQVEEGQEFATARELGKQREREFCDLRGGDEAAAGFRSEHGEMGEIGGFRQSKNRQNALAGNHFYPSLARSGKIE